LWRYGTDLGDLYRGEMTLRQLWVRMQALPADCPFWLEVEAERERDAVDQQARDIDNVLDMFKPKKG
jgi:hypothetical protein